ncbi:MAG: T9SS type A sorting domain-containing protein [Bacteroidota bacterium]
MKLPISLLLVLISSAAFAQNSFWDTDFPTFPVSTYEEQNNLVFGSLNPLNYPSKYIYDRTDYNSMVLQMNGNNLSDTINYDYWLAMYNEMLIAYQSSSEAIPPGQPETIDTWYSAKEVYDETEDAIIEGNLNIPIGIMNFDYHKLKPNALDDNLIFVDGESFKDSPGATENPFEQRKLFAAVPMLDTVESTTLHFKVDLSFYFRNDCTSWTSFKIDFDDGNGLQTVSAGNTYTVNYSNTGGKTLYFEMDCGGQILKNNAQIYILPSFSSLSRSENEDFSYDEVVDLSANNVFGKLGVKYGCGNTQIRKPAIFVSGYNPYAPFKSDVSYDVTIGGVTFSPFTYNDLENFYVKYNDGGLLDELQSKGYDICVFRANNGADSVANGAALLIDAIEYVNNEKAQNNSNHENIVVGFSYGAVIARVALATMEEDFFENNGSFHHSKLYVSYEGEHQGASIVLGYQHALESMVSNTLSNFIPCSELLATADFIGTTFLEGSQLFDSHLGREILLNHPIATGTPNSPASGAHPKRQALIDKLENTNHLHTKVNGYPALMRNVGMSKGASDASMRNFDAGEILFRFDRGFNSPWFSTEQQMEIRSIDDGTRVFLRQKARRFIFGGWRNIIDEQFQVPNPEVPIENSNSSTIGNSNILGSTIKACAVSLNPDVHIKEDDAFVPVYSALDIRNRLPNDPYYDVKANQLLFVEQGLENDFYGYPHINHNNPLSITPFEAIFILEENGDHSPGSDGEIPQIYRFFITEIQPDTLTIQNRRIGQYINDYETDFEARDYITLGRDITFQTAIGNASVENNGRVQLKAGRAITFEPGVSIELGSTLSTNIQSLAICSSNRNNNSRNTDKNSTSTIINQDLTSPSKSKLNRKIQVFPNPNTGRFTIGSQQPIQKIELYDLTGKLRFGINNVNTIETNDLKGIFLLKVTVENHEVFYEKIIIK